MKKPLLNQIERYAIRENDSIWAKGLEVRLAKAHFKRELGRTAIGKFFRGIIEWLSKVLN